MKLPSWTCWIFLPLLGMFLLAAAGCGQAGQATAKGAKDKPAQGARAQKEKESHEHGDWWCAEHGIPEEVCGQCNAKLAADFKKKGDWCKEHDRPESQCFTCHPEAKEKFAAQYRAKYGKEPPPIEDEEKGKKEDKE